MSNTSSLEWQRPFIVLATVALTTTILYFASAILIPIVLAILFAFILRPLVTLLQNRGLGRVPAVLVVVAIVSVIVVGIGWAVIGQFQQLASELPKHSDTIKQKIAGIHVAGGATGNLVTLFKDVSDELEKANPFKSPNDVPALSIPVVVTEASTPGSFGIFSRVAQPLLEFIASVLLVLVLMIFMLIYREDLRNRVISLAGVTQLTSTTRVIDDSARRISSYLTIQVMINVGFAFVLGIGVLLIGVPYFLLWGLLCGLLRFIPYVGTWFGAAILMVFCIAVFPGWKEPLMTAVLFVTLELVVSNVVEPLLFGKGTGLSPVALLISAAFWTWLWGPIGLILSTPIMVCLVVLGKHIPQMKVFEIMLGNGPGLDTEVSFYQRLLARDPDEATDLVEQFVAKRKLETVYDEVFLPALVLAKRDRDRGELLPLEEQRILSVMQQIMEGLAVEPRPESESPSADQRLQSEDRIIIAGYAGQDPIDQLALQMLQQILESSGRHIEILSSKTLASEAVSWVQDERPGVLILAAVPPGGIAQAQYLCKRLRTNNPELKILVGRWGMTENLEQARNRLTAAGANSVTDTFLQTRDQIMPWLKAPAPIANHRLPALASS